MPTVSVRDTFTGGAGALQGHAPETVPDAATWGATTGPLGSRVQNLDGAGLTIPSASGGTGIGTARLTFSTTGVDTSLGVSLAFVASIDAGKVTGDVVRCFIEGDDSLPGAVNTIASISLEVDGAGAVQLTSFVQDTSLVQYPFAVVEVVGSTPTISIVVNGLDADLYIDEVLIESIVLGAPTYAYITNVALGSYYSAPAGPSGMSEVEVQRNVAPGGGWELGGTGPSSPVLPGPGDPVATLMPVIRTRFVDADQLPLVGGKVYTYAAGTSTPKASYTDSTMGSSNTNPVILDTRGEADIWLNGAYKIIVTDSLDVLIPDHTVDNVRDWSNDATYTNPTLAGTPVVTASAVTWSGNPTHSGNHTWSGTQNFNGNVVIGDASTDTLTVAPNAVTWSNNPTHSGNHTFSGNLAVTGTQAFTGNTTLTTWAGTTSGSVKLSATGVPYGTSIHNNAGAVTGTTNQYICSGTYTPTLFNTSNVAASTCRRSMD